MVEKGHFPVGRRIQVRTIFFLVSCQRFTAYINVKKGLSTEL